MLIRNKTGEFKIDNSILLLDYLGVKKESTGVQKVAADVELVASVPFLVRSEKGEVRSEKEKEDFAWTLSTFDLDRFGERIDPHGWDLKQYCKNPIVEWSHRFDIPAIGKIEKLTVDDDGLHGVVIFNDKEYDQFGWSIGQRVKAGVIRAGSVGFRILEIEIPSKEDSKDGTSLIFRKQELLEFSICNVPANPWALAKSKEQRAMSNEKSEIAPDYWGGLIHTQSNEQ